MTLCQSICATGSSLGSGGERRRRRLTLRAQPLPVDGLSFATFVGFGLRGLR